jgi:hypothetical protein
MLRITMPLPPPPRLTIDKHSAHFLSSTPPPPLPLPPSKNVDQYTGVSLDPEDEVSMQGKQRGVGVVGWLGG